MEIDVGQAAIALFQRKIGFFGFTKSNAQIVDSRMGTKVNTIFATNLLLLYHIPCCYIALRAVI